MLVKLEPELRTLEQVRVLVKSLASELEWSRKREFDHSSSPILVAVVGSQE